MSDETVYVDHDIAVLFDQLGQMVPLESGPQPPEFASTDDATGDEALIEVVTEVGRALQSLHAQVQILRNEMRLTMLNAFAADEYQTVEAIATPTEDE